MAITMQNFSTSMPILMAALTAWHKPYVVQLIESGVGGTRLTENASGCSLLFTAG
jgi:hypothetical protein